MSGKGASWGREFLNPEDRMLKHIIWGEGYAEGLPEPSEDAEWVHVASNHKKKFDMQYAYDSQGNLWELRLIMDDTY